MIAKIETKYKISKTFFADTHFTCSNIDESKNNFTIYLFESYFDSQSRYESMIIFNFLVKTKSYFVNS